MSGKLAVGQTFPPLDMRNIHGGMVSVPDGEHRWTHLQFRRFAGCPACNVHLQTFIQRYEELSRSGIKEVVVFHSTDDELLPFQGRFPFDVIGDAEKLLYKRFGVESSIWAVLNPLAWPGAKGNFLKDKPTQKGLPKGGIFGLPADVLVSPEGIVEAIHYGKHAYDQWTVDEVVGKARRVL